MIVILCPCGKSISAKPEWAGIGIRCAGCGRSHFLDAPAVEVDARPAKPCPHCAARILAAAIKCRYCGRFVQEEPAAAPPPPSRGADSGGTAVLVIGIVSSVLCWLPSPVAWILGASYEADCRARGVEPSGAGRAGKIVGIVGTAFLVLSVVFLALLLAAGAA